MAHGINIYSEIGKLNRVMLHRMGLELEALVPDNFERLLFDEIPYLKVAQYEHDCFANVLKENGIKVHYFTDEVAKSIKNENIRKEFVKEFIRDSDVHSNYIAETIEQYLLKLPLETMVDTIIAGIKKADLKINKIDSLGDFVNKDYPYYTDPMPNLYFMRDPGTFIGNTVNINCMKSKARKRESLMFKYISLYNKELVPEGTDINVFEGGNFIEGGDILVLSEEIIAVGISQRTSAYAIETLAEKLLNQNNTFKKILVLDIPKRRAFMHLDTVFTMVDHDKFTIHPEIEGSLNIYEVTLGKSGCSQFCSSAYSLEDALKNELKLPAVQMIRCGGTNIVAAQREQWNDASNTFAIAPGVVITYERNSITNELLDKSNVKVIAIPSSELSRGRGGPRCMSMPIHRDHIN
ncbi:MAG: arginine deiminase [Anaerovoracaceae bacterium]|jgi:arginine deiminase